MAINKDRMLAVVAEYRSLRLEVIELRRAGHLSAAIERATHSVEFLEHHQEGLAYLIEAAHDLATLYGAVGDWASAELIFEKCRYVRDGVCGPRDKDTATAMMMLGVAKYFLHKYPEAEALLATALAIREEVLGSSHADVALALTNLAAVYRATERSAEAQELWDRAVRIGLPAGFQERPN